MKLYEIEEAYYDWMGRVIEAEGELSEELLAELDAIRADGDGKVEAYACLIKTADAESIALDAEIKRLTARKDKRDNLSKRLKSRLSDFMALTERRKFETAKVCVSFRTSTAVNITNEELIPAEFRRETVKVDYPLTPIKDAIKAGINVPGAEIIEKQNIQIK